MFFAKSLNCDQKKRPENPKHNYLSPTYVVNQSPFSGILNWRWSPPYHLSNFHNIGLFKYLRKKWDAKPEKFSILEVFAAQATYCSLHIIVLSLTLDYY